VILLQKYNSKKFAFLDGHFIGRIPFNRALKMGFSLRSAPSEREKKANPNSKRFQNHKIPQLTEAVESANALEEAPVRGITNFW